MQKQHIMFIGDGPFSGTGFSEELRHIAFRLVHTGEFKITWLSLQHLGSPIDIPDTLFTDIPHKGGTIRLVGKGKTDPYSFGAEIFPRHFLTELPDVVLFMGDPKNIRPYIPLKQKFAFPLYMYVTLDGLPIHPMMIEPLRYVNVLITMTEWAQLEYVKVGLNPAFIHHGINWNWWATNEKEKKRLRRKYKIPEDCVVYISWDVNQHRKRFDALLRCWKEFHPESKNAKLILYCDWNMENSLGWKLDDIIKEYDIPRDTIIDPIQLTCRPKDWMCPEPVEILREIACLGDVYLSTTSGEGFGKCALEALSLGIVVIITDYSACSEVCKRGSILVPTIKMGFSKYGFRWHDRVRVVEGGIVNEEKFVEAMLYLYNNEEERKKLGKQAREWAREFDYDTKVIPAWVELLNKINPDLILQRQLLTT